VKDGSCIVAKMWCDLEEFNFPTCFRKLESHEAYLFNAYTDPTVRGHSLAPFMRQQCYAALRARGRDTFYSYTDYFSTASRRFKQKLGAVDESLRVHVSLFGRLSRTFTLRR
jgi:ribosomal protein S18 acetylase RimI-like enzyme